MRDYIFRVSCSQTEVSRQSRNTQHSRATGGAEGTATRAARARGQLSRCGAGPQVEVTRCCLVWREGRASEHPFTDLYILNIKHHVCETDLT